MTEFNFYAFIISHSIFYLVFLHALSQVSPVDAEIFAAPHVVVTVGAAAEPHGLAALIVADGLAPSLAVSVAEPHGPVALVVAV